MFFQLGLIDWAMIIIAIIIIILVALQSAKDDISNALTGANSELFKNQKERGAEVYIVRATYTFAILFIALAAINFIAIG